MKSNDVVIVGAGPAGSTLAHRLASQGVDVAVLEKSQMPRVKPCGGGCDAILMDNLPPGVSLEPVIQDMAAHLLVRYQGHNESTYSIPEPIAMTERHQLDWFLLEEAEGQGAKVYQKTNVQRLQRHPGYYEIETPAGSFRARIVVGADGAYSTVARLADIPRPRTVFIAAEWDIDATADVLKQWRGKAMIDCSVRPLGYAWIFPKWSSLNVGFGLPKKFAKGIHDTVAKFAERERLLQYPYRKFAHWIPFAKPESKARVGPILLVGDAAGLADPTTGAGISWGVRSSARAAPWIYQALKTNDLEYLEGYEDDYRQTLKELQAGESLRNLLILHFALRRRDHPQVLQWMLQCLSNRKTYLEWAGEHPLLYRLGRLLQKTLVERLI